MECLLKVPDFLGRRAPLSMKMGRLSRNRPIFNSASASQVRQSEDRNCPWHLLGVIAFYILNLEIVWINNESEVVGPRRDPARDGERSGKRSSEAR